MAKTNKVLATINIIILILIVAMMTPIGGCWVWNYNRKSRKADKILGEIEAREARIEAYSDGFKDCLNGLVAYYGTNVPINVILQSYDSGAFQ
jgi:flagellar basal body-associated protein FliL